MSEYIISLPNFQDSSLSATLNTLDTPTSGEGAQRVCIFIKHFKISQIWEGGTLAQFPMGILTPWATF